MPGATSCHRDARYAGPAAAGLLSCAAPIPEPPSSWLSMTDLANITFAAPRRKLAGTVVLLVGRTSCWGRRRGAGHRGVCRRAAGAAEFTGKARDDARPAGPRRYRARPAGGARHRQCGRDGERDWLSLGGAAMGALGERQGGDRAPRAPRRQAGPPDRRRRFRARHEAARLRFDNYTKKGDDGPTPQGAGRDHRRWSPTLPPRAGPGARAGDRRWRAARARSRQRAGQRARPGRVRRRAPRR